MPDPIKKQIMDRVLANLAPLKTNGTFRDITREWDVLRPSKALPALMVADGEERTVSSSGTVWTCRFDLHLRVVFPFARDKDALVSEVQKKIEGDMTLNSLGSIVNAGNEEPAVVSASATVHRTELRYTVEYTRKIGDPTAVS
ncbi:MAG TPA: hypothetical protein VJ063_16005 [Verrucomicrobiae bacterium]|nr:hypothetical protein [Verrucomicrobiae bacterium]